MCIRVVSPEEVQAALAALRERHGATDYDGRGPPTKTSVGLRNKKDFETQQEQAIEKAAETGAQRALQSVASIFTGSPKSEVVAAATTAAAKQAMIAATPQANPPEDKRCWGMLKGYTRLLQQRGSEESPADPTPEKTKKKKVK